MAIINSKKAKKRLPKTLTSRGLVRVKNAKSEMLPAAK
jgi:hypothetical protein